MGSTWCTPSASRSGRRRRCSAGRSSSCRPRVGDRGVRRARAERRHPLRRHRASRDRADRHRAEQRRDRALPVSEDVLPRDLSAGDCRGRRAGPRRGGRGSPRPRSCVMPGCPLFVALGVARTLAFAPPVTPVVTEAVSLAGDWARTHVPPACVDYLVGDGYTGYWLHLAVLGNPRAAGRALEADTFEPAKAIVRLDPAGRPALRDRGSLRRPAARHPQERGRPGSLRPSGRRPTPRRVGLRQHTLASYINTKTRRTRRQHEETFFLLRDPSSSWCLRG